MKILVTGADGYIGRHVVKKLLDRGASVTALDLVTDEIDNRATRISGDIFSGEEDLYDRYGRPDALIHLAWRNGFNHYAESHIGDLPRHDTFLRNMMAAGLPQLVVMSTMHEVGYFEGAITEQTPANPVTPYGISKNALRQLCEVYARKYGTVLQWLRGYYILGDDTRNNSIFSKMVEADAAGQKLFPFTTGRDKFDFITVDELANQVAACSMQRSVTGIINVCSGTAVSLAEECERFIAEHGLKIRLDYGKFPDRADASPAVWGDPAKIRAIMDKDTYKG